MKMCNIVFGDLPDDDLTIKKLKKRNPFVNFIHVDEYKKTNNLPTLWYGLKLTKSYFGDKFNMLSKNLGGEDKWCYAQSEREDSDIDLFIHDSMSKFLLYVDDGIDPVFDGFDLDRFMEDLSPYPLIHNGKYELYFCEYFPKNEEQFKVFISSMKKDALVYAGHDPEEVFYEAIDFLDGECYVLDTREFDFFCIDYEPIFIVDFIQAKTGDILPPEVVVRSFSPRYVTKGELLTYYLKLANTLRINDFSNAHRG